MFAVNGQQRHAHTVQRPGSYLHINYNIWERFGSDQSAKLANSFLSGLWPILLGNGYAMCQVLPTMYNPLQLSNVTMKPNVTACNYCATSGLQRKMQT